MSQSDTKDRLAALEEEVESLKTQLEEAYFEVSELEETIKSMDMQAGFLEGFVAYLRKAGHWFYVRKYLENYFARLEEQKRAASDALRAFVFSNEGRDDIF